MAKKKFRTFYDNEFERVELQYPDSKVLLDPTCTLEQILNRAQYGISVPQRDVSGDITQEELAVLGIAGNDFSTLTRMQIIDLKMKAQMRMNAIEAKKRKLEQSAREEALRKGAVDEYIKLQSANIPT